MVTLSPPVSVVDIEQGQTVTYTVSATDADGDQISLRPSATLPPNATFGPTNPVIGTGSVSGTFSFTPDINQSGSYVFTFTGTDNAATPASGSTSLTVNVAELQYDRLFTVSADGQSPVGGMAGAREVLFPITW